MTITDWIQATSAAVVAVLTVFLWLLARRQTELLDNSVRVATDAADAARKSAEMAERALIGVQRPLLRMTIGQFTITPSPKLGFDEYRAVIRLQNIGREAAILLDGAAQFTPTVPDIRPPKPGVDPFDRFCSIVDIEPGEMILPGNDLSFEISRYMDPAKGERIENFGSLRGGLFVYGLVIYDDLLGFRRELGFTVAWSASDSLWFRCSFDGHNFDRIIDPQANPIKLTPVPDALRESPV